MSAAGMGAAVLGAAPAAEAQVVYQPADWHMAEFDKLCKSKARVKQVFDASALRDGDVFLSMKNSMNGLHFGFGVPAADIKVVAALRGPANMINFDDSMWAKYKLGEFLKVDDPDTSKPATRNIFYPKKGFTGTDLNDRKSMYQDTGIAALMERGLQMLSCHNATESFSIRLVEKLGITVPVEDVVHDLQAHTLPGVISVPAMVSALGMLQTDGHYTYIAAG